MDNFITPVAAWCVAIIEALGIGVIMIFVLYSMLNATTRILQKDEKESIYQDLRQSLGRGILLGLELLIAADIIYTVAVKLSFQSIGVLAIVVLIRAFLSLTMEVEISGRWPWQGRH
ncbi:MAG: DUF1622 domain-containing protein [Desulfohalobiaceae bacterium]